MSKKAKTIYDMERIIQVIKLSDKGKVTYIHRTDCPLTDILERTFAGISEKLSDIEFNNGWYALFKTGEILGPAPTYSECTHMEWQYALSRFLEVGNNGVEESRPRRSN